MSHFVNVHMYVASSLNIFAKLYIHYQTQAIHSALINLQMCHIFPYYTGHS